MYLAELTRNLKRVTAAFNSSWKAKEICRSAWVKWLWELLHIGTDSRDEDYRQNLCTKLTSIPQPSLAHILAHMACMKMSKCAGKTKKAQLEEPLTIFDKTGTKNASFKYILACFNFFAIGQCHGTSYRLSIFFSQSDAKFSNLFQWPGESSSLKHISRVIWRPTYRDTIHWRKSLQMLSHLHTLTMLQYKGKVTGPIA